MTEREEALRAAIWAAPDDLAAYRVYADYLIEQGSGLGEYMQLQLVDGQTPEQRRRGSALLKKRGDWLGAARPFVRSWTNDDRGFVETAVCEAQQVPDGFAHLLRLGPRMRLCMTSFNKRHRATVAAAGTLALGRFHALAMSSGLDDRDLEVLGPALAGIRHLDLSNNSFSAVGLRGLGAHVAGIQSLLLVSWNYAPEWVDAIVESAGFASLAHVVLHGHNRSTQQPDESQLARLRAMPNMKTVNDARAIELARQGATP